MVRRSRQCRTIAIVSGKGGVGKSNVALNLSILLSAAGHRVALVDADLGLANLDILMGLRIQYTLAHVIAGRKSLRDVVVELPSGVQFIPGASGLARVADLADFQRAKFLSALSALEEENDILIIDTAAGIGPGVLQFALSAENVVAVTTPEPTAMTDVYATLKVLTQRDYSGKMSLLLNMVSGRAEARESYQRVAGVARQFLDARVLDAGYVVTDSKVNQAVRNREPFVLAWPRCPASRCLAALASKLCTGGALVRRKDSFFRRVANWFA